MRIDREKLRSCLEPLLSVMGAKSLSEWVAYNLAESQSEFIIPDPPTLSAEGVTEIMKRQGQRPQPEPIPPEIEKELVAEVSWSRLHNNYMVEFGRHRHFTSYFDDAIRHAWRIAQTVKVEDGASRAASRIIPSAHP